MIHAYDEIYLDNAMENLGDAFDYIFFDCHMDKDEFFQLFISSGIANEFGNGNPAFVAGMSGPELAATVLEKVGLSLSLPVSSENAGKSSSYWCGWILAYYQWYSSMPFKEISRYVTIQEIENLYSTLHEAPEEKFISVMQLLREQRHKSVKLQTYRKNIGMSQKELSKQSGVSLRSIQMYEQRNKDINKAQAINVYRLAKTLGCRMEDLFEY